MTVPVFVDTNVLVYARDSSEPVKQQVAAARLRQLWVQESGRISSQVLNEYYVTVTRKLKPGLSADAAWDDVHALMAWNPQPTDRELMNAAHDIERRYKLSWWDSLIVAAATLQDCEILLSEDLQTGMRFGPVRVVNPFSMQAEEPAPKYDVPLPSRPRHRSRGRPTRLG